MSYHKESRKLFGGETWFTIHEADELLASAAIDSAFEEGLRLHKIFNAFDPSSELSRLNTKRKMKVSGELISLIEEAKHIHRVTVGQYDISLGTQMMQRKSHKKETIEIPDITKIRIENNLVYLDDPRIMLDTGSIAKGYIADRMAEQLKDEGIISALIDARGDIVVFGNLLQKVKIQHPRNPQESIFSFNIKDKAVATSGDYQQYYEDFKRSHILNQKELISVTVVAPTLMEADALSTAIFVSDPDIRKKLINLHPSSMVITIDKGLVMKKHNWEEM